MSRRHNDAANEDGSLEWRAGTGGLFLRAERLHSHAEGFTQRGRWKERIDRPILELSHGEGFLQVLAGMIAEPGLYMLDMIAGGSQILLATHSPILAALPGAQLRQLDDRGITPVDYDGCDLVTSWRSFMSRPDSFLRHLT